ncbi:biotin/lipoyl-containing protein [Thermanaerothrix sp. 4228-RoL]|uniref:Biotin/lipoyl-containing protein n=2 Tax=Thermanaerothrix TaxID=1077886 RepID=A0ABU3NQ92_9CHLR|nr:biotin/lipoyl-containing protein [Thermanaerothrix sp. 4228-RoL]MDT8898962.1 biotin/lipoyl-containing protein [Thermanaerothrix sp. 4228-RoL]
MKFRIKIEDQIFTVTIDDLTSRPIRVQVDGELFEVWPEGETESPTVPVALPVPPPPPITTPCTSPPSRPTVSTNQGGRHCVKAPLPGVITAIAVRPGDQVEYGQDLLTLEAMKMKNAIRATRAGTIAAVHVNVGDQVQHGQVLLEFTD